MTQGYWSEAAANTFTDRPDWLHLDEEVEDRLSRFSNAADRHASFSGRALALLCAARLVGVQPDAFTLHQRCGVCGSHAHGRPFVVGPGKVCVSWSHTRQRVAAVAAVTPVAIDLELPRSPQESIVKRSLSSFEELWLWHQQNVSVSFAQLWCLKECAIKLGLITLDSLQTMSFCDSVSILSSHGAFRITDSSVGDHVIAVMSESALEYLPLRELQKVPSTHLSEPQGYLRSHG